MVGDHVHSHESVLDFSGHTFDDLDLLLVHLTLVIVNGEVFPGSAKVNWSLFHRVFVFYLIILILTSIAPEEVEQSSVYQIKLS